VLFSQRARSPVNQQLEFLLLLFRHAPVPTSSSVHSTKHRHQTPEWTILSHVDCVIQTEAIGFQVLQDSLCPCSTRVSSWHLLRLAFQQCGRARRNAVLGLVVRLTSSSHTRQHHLNPNSFRRHHGLKASKLV